MHNVVEKQVPYHTIQSDFTLTEKDFAEDNSPVHHELNLYWLEREAFLKRVMDACAARKVRSVKGIRRVHNELRRKENLNARS